MKKQVLFFVAALASLSLQAQVKVAGNGNMSIQGNDSTPLSALSIGSAGDSIYKVYVESDKNGVYVHSKDTQNRGFAIDAMRTVPTSGTGYAIRGMAGRNTNTLIGNGPKVCGVFGEAQFNGSNSYGVVGFLSGGTNSYGAGVFGAACPIRDFEHPYQIYPLEPSRKRYAGYFYGDVHIEGDLAVAGEIASNVFLIPTITASNYSNQRNARSTESANQTIDKLGALETYSYYNESTETALSAVNAEQSTAMTADMDEASRKHYTLDVEQLEEVYPELVYDLGDGKKGINYVELVPILVQGINELKAEVEQLKAAASSQRTQRNTTAVDENMVEADIATLAQNDPNPFETSSTIRLNVPESVGEALLVFYDLNGKQIKQLSVETRGRSEHTVTSADFAPGMYIYALVTDGKVVETRRMLLLK